MGTNLNELVTRVHEGGARLRVVKERLELQGNLSENVRAEIRENQQALTEYLTYDQEAAYELLRAARAYISERYRTGSNLDTETLDEQIARAEMEEDMWALRIAVREWVLVWVRATSQARETAA